MTDALKRLSDEGVAIWLDDLSRKRITSGNLAELIDQSARGGRHHQPVDLPEGDLRRVTATTASSTDLAARKVTVEEAIRMITTADVRDAADILRPVFDATDGQDGRVSIEVDPRLAHNTRATVAEAKQLAWLVDRPNTLIKIPATKAGLPAITETIGLGISVNVTLIFSLERYREVMDAYLDRPGEGQGARPGPLEDPLGGVLLRVPRGHRDRQADRRAGHGRGQGRPRQGGAWPTPASPTRRTRRSSPPTAGRRSTRRTPTSSARCGPRPASRTRRTRTPCTSTSWWRPTR